MSGHVVRYLSGHVRGTDRTDTAPLKGLSVRCPVSGSEQQLRITWSDFRGSRNRFISVAPEEGDPRVYEGVRPKEVDAYPVVAGGRL
jgi:hypothetical protein